MTDRICSIEACGRPHYGRGWCRSHYERERRTGRAEALTTSERFWQYVQKTPSCWSWIGSKKPVGYGEFWWTAELDDNNPYEETP